MILNDIAPEAGLDLEFDSDEIYLAMARSCEPSMSMMIKLELSIWLQSSHMIPSSFHVTDSLHEPHRWVVQCHWMSSSGVIRICIA